MKPTVTKKYREQAGVDKTSTQKILEVLFVFPNIEFSLTDLAKKSKVTKMHTSRIVEKLQKNNLILVEKLSKIWRIKANSESDVFRQKKIAHNLSSIFDSNLIELLKDKFNSPKTIVLFGSYRLGEDIQSSDIDIAVEVDAGKKYEVLQLKALLSIEKKLNRKIQVHVFGRKNVDINVFNNIANGIVLAGFLEVKP